MGVAHTTRSSFGQDLLGLLVLAHGQSFPSLNAEYYNSAARGSFGSPFGRKLDPSWCAIDIISIPAVHRTVSEALQKIILLDEVLGFVI